MPVFIVWDCFNIPFPFHTQSYVSPHKEKELTLTVSSFHPITHPPTRNMTTPLSADPREITAFICRQLAQNRGESEKQPGENKGRSVKPSLSLYFIPPMKTTISAIRAHFDSAANSMKLINGKHLTPPPNLLSGSFSLGYPCWQSSLSYQRSGTRYTQLTQTDMMQHTETTGANVHNLILLSMTSETDASKTQS